MKTSLASLASGVGVTPSPSGLPGISSIQGMVGGLLFYALIACLAGFAISVATWGIANKAGSSHVAAGGKIGAIVAIAGAFLVGAAPALIDWANGAGSLIK